VAIDAFNELFNIVYIAKKLHDMKKHELIKSSFSDTVEYDVYYENMYNLIANIFEHHRCSYYEDRGVDLHILSDKVIVDFFILAGKYGRRNNISDGNNPYIREAHEETNQHLNISSHCLDWKLMGYTEPRRPFHSRLGLFIGYECDCLDLGVLAYRLLMLYEWFADKCVELCNILLEDARGQLMLDTNMGVAA
jgi:hypothetical protein